MSAMPVMLAVLCLMAIAYRYYSAFLAAKVAALDDARATPAVRLDDGQNYHPTNKWVVFGHHFAAISGAGPLIGPVLAAQFGYLPGLLWIVIGVCLGGAVQDFLILAASLRRDGRSLAQIAYTDVGRAAGTAAVIAIIFILIIALAGLGKVVVKALGGEAVAYPANSVLEFPPDAQPHRGDDGIYTIPARSYLYWGSGQSIQFTDAFQLKTPTPLVLERDQLRHVHQRPSLDGRPIPPPPDQWEASLPPGSVRLVSGSSWGTFTIAATIPIALFVGFYMYRIRKGRVIEASLIGGVLTLGATVLGGWVASHSVGRWFNLSGMQVTWAMALYGFVASVLPVWVLLVPRDYLSSFLKIGTIGLLVIGTLLANPTFQAPAINHEFLMGGPAVKGRIFPFLFITIMCGAISGFHALVSSGTTPKMVKKESDARMIGYGAMLIEALVGVVAMTAAATLPVRDYYAMNTELDKVPAFNDRILKVAGAGGVEHIAQDEQLTQESLRGRTGGAVTLAVGMADIFDGAVRRFGPSAEHAVQAMWKYWFHFAIMFEALFILTTIDAGTRVGRFLLQEVMGKIHPNLGRTDWWPGAFLATFLIVAGWAYFLNSDNFATIWGMFGVANQMLAVIALAVGGAWLANEGRVRYVWVTVVPMAVVMTTTGTAGVQILAGLVDGLTTQWNNPSSAARSTALFNAALQATLILGMLLSAGVVVIASGRRVLHAMRISAPQRRGFEPILLGGDREFRD